MSATTRARAALLVTLAAATLAAPLRAQSGAASHPQVLVLGTPHLANPGLDAMNQKVDDVLAPKRQVELERIADHLAAWRPTRIAVEVTPASDSALQAAYARYRRGELPPDGKPSRSETMQIGMRLAKRLGHTRLYPIDVKRDIDVNGVFAYAAQHGQGALVQRAQRTMGVVMARADSVMRHGTLVDVLRLANDPAADTLHGLYLQAATIGVPSGVGADTTFVGARMAADWYARNLMMYANVAKLAEPGERVLVIVGAGHGTLLREFLARSGLVDVVPAGAVLDGGTATR